MPPNVKITQLIATNSTICAIALKEAKKSIHLRSIHLFDVMAIALCKDGVVRTLYMSPKGPAFCEDLGECTYFRHYKAAEDELRRDPEFADCTIYNFTANSYGKILRRTEEGFKTLNKGLK